MSQENSLLKGSPLPKIWTYSTLSSTNDVLKDHARQGAPSGSMVIGDRQTAGRGSRGRSWMSSQVGNLFCSFLWRHPGPSQSLSQLSFVVAVAVGNALSRFLEILERNEGYNKISIEHKWPNDILFEGRKGAGILLESSGGQMPEWVVIGVGVNLGEAPVLNDGTLAGTLLPGGDQVSQETRLLWRDRVAGFMREEWELARHRWQEEGFEVIRQKWLEGAVGRGKPLMARLPTGEISGKFLDIDALGRLCLELPSGEVEKISSADIFLI